MLVVQRADNAPQNEKQGELKALQVARTPRPPVPRKVQNYQQQLRIRDRKGQSRPLGRMDRARQQLQYLVNPQVHESGSYRLRRARNFRPQETLWDNGNNKRRESNICRIKIFRPECSSLAIIRRPTRPLNHRCPSLHRTAHQQSLEKRAGGLGASTRHSGGIPQRAQGSPYCEHEKLEYIRRVPQLCGHDTNATTDPSQIRRSTIRPLLPRNGCCRCCPLSMLYALYHAPLIPIVKSNETNKCIFGFIDVTTILATGKNFDETHKTIIDMVERKWSI